MIKYTQIRRPPWIKIHASARPMARPSRHDKYKALSKKLLPAAHRLRHSPG